MKSIFIRVDSSSVIGSGHLFRCLSLAEAFRKNAKVTFLSRALKGNSNCVVTEKGFQLVELSGSGDAEQLSWYEDAKQIISLVTGADLLVVDHYGLDEKWEKACRGTAKILLTIDDLANRNHSCDYLLDNGLFSEPAERYQGRLNSEAVLLAGPAYSLLRPEFAEYKKRLRRDYSSASKVLSFFGAADPSRSALLLLEALEDWTGPALELTLIVSLADPMREEIFAKASNFSFVKCLDSAPDMAALMASSDIFLGSGGTITWERACLGLPSIVVAVIENQFPSCDALGAAGKILYLGPAREVHPKAMGAALRLLLLNEEQRRLLGEGSGKLVDGKGPARLARILISEKVSLRPATEGDARRIFEWRNDPRTRSSSLNSSAIEFDSHLVWLRSSFLNQSRALLIAEDAEGAVGVLRLDRVGLQATVSIFLDPKKQGLGIGPQILKAGKIWIQANWPEVRSLLADVKTNNRASVSAFSEVGFIPSHTAFVQNLS